MNKTVRELVRKDHFRTEVDYPDYSDGRIMVRSNGRIGRYIYYPKLIIQHYGAELPLTLRILDVACGAAADHPFIMDYFKDINLELIGIDINSTTINHTIGGGLSYPLERDMRVGINNSLAFLSTPNNPHPEAAPKYDITRYFNTVETSDETLFHMDLDTNKLGGRWVMKEEWCSKLDLICADATQIPFPDASMDVIIAKNFLFGGTDSISQLILREIDRVLKPNGCYLGDPRIKLQF